MPKEGYSMSMHERFLLSAACFSFGMVLGFLLSPIKKGVTVTCGNNNGMPPWSRPGARPVKTESASRPDGSREEKL